MSGIVCALRGRPDSQPTSHCSISLAQDSSSTNDNLQDNIFKLMELKYV